MVAPSFIVVSVDEVLKIGRNIFSAAATTAAAAENLVFVDPTCLCAVADGIADEIGVAFFAQDSDIVARVDVLIAATGLQVGHNISRHFSCCPFIVGLKLGKSLNHNESPKLIVAAVKTPTQDIGTCAVFGAFNIKHKISVEINFDSVKAAARVEESKLILSAFEERSRGNVGTVGGLSVGDINRKIGVHGDYRIKMRARNALDLPLAPIRVNVVDNNVGSPVAGVVLNGELFVESKLRLNRVNAVGGISNAECKCRRRED